MPMLSRARDPIPFVTKIGGYGSRRSPGRRDCCSRDPSMRAKESHALAGAERLEGDDGVGVLDAGNGLHLLVDEMADVGVVVDVELDQQVVIPCGGINLRGDLGFGERVGDGIGLAELAFELDEERNHRCRLPKGVSSRSIYRSRTCWQ